MNLKSIQKVQRMQLMMLQKRCPVCETKGVQFKIGVDIRRSFVALKPTYYKRKYTLVRCKSRKCRKYGQASIIKYPFLPKGEILSQAEVFDAYIRDQIKGNKEKDFEESIRSGQLGRPATFAVLDDLPDGASPSPSSDEEDSHSSSSADPK